MRIVVALGGNALLRRSDPMTTAVQRRNIRIAAQALAPLTAEHRPSPTDKPSRTPLTSWTREPKA